jgi:hypothetical protein
MKNIYEVFDEFEAAKNKQQRMDVIGRNLSKVLTEVLQLGFHPQPQWYFDEIPEGFVIKDVPAGMSYAQLSTEMRKLYMFQKGNPTADKLTDKKREQLLVELLQNLEPREAEVVMGIFRKDFGVKGLDYKFVKEAFPAMLP